MKSRAPSDRGILKWLKHSPRKKRGQAVLGTAFHGRWEPKLIKIADVLDHLDYPRKNFPDASKAGGGRQKYSISMASPQLTEFGPPFRSLPPHVASHSVPLRRDLGRWPLLAARSAAPNNGIRPFGRVFMFLHA
jgi:hypothetical protein